MESLDSVLILAIFAFTYENLRNHHTCISVLGYHDVTMASFPVVGT